jgi:hypothetical protein
MTLSSCKDKDAQQLTILGFVHFPTSQIKKDSIYIVIKKVQLQVILMERDSIPDYIGDMMFPVMFVHSTSAFETLKSKGINLIKNDSLRDEIISVYDSGYSFFLKNESNIVLDEAERALRELFSTRFEESYVYDFNEPNYKPRLTPLNYEALKTDQEFKYFLKSFKNRLNLLLNFHYQRTLIKIVKDLINSIDDELITKIK